MIITVINILKGNDYPFEIYEHGSAYYNDSFVIIGGYSSLATSLSSIYL